MLVAGFQGVSTAQGRHDARPRRLGHHRRRARRRRRRRRLRDLHRRRRRLHAPTRGSCPTRASSPSSPSTRCSRWRRPAPACCSCAASSTRATTACASTADRASTTRPVPSSCRRRGNHGTARSSPPSPTRTARPASRCIGVPDTPGVAGRVTTALADANVNIDMIIQNEPALRGRARRAVVHGPARRPRRGAHARWTPIARRARDRGRRPTRRWARSRSSAPG